MIVNQWNKEFYFTNFPLKFFFEIVVNQILDMLYESDALVDDDGDFKELIYPYNNH
jgi:hypothetical protein